LPYVYDSLPHFCLIFIGLLFAISEGFLQSVFCTGDNANSLLGVDTVKKVRDESSVILEERLDQNKKVLRLSEKRLLEMDEKREAGPEVRLIVSIKKEKRTSGPFFGGGYRSRTGDLLHAMQTL
jgi:hypothetical protein